MQVLDTFNMFGIDSFFIKQKMCLKKIKHHHKKNK